MLNSDDRLAFFAFIRGKAVFAFPTQITRPRAITRSPPFSVVKFGLAKC